MSRCKQCHTDGHHKMSCTDESNQARKDRVTVPTSLPAPIVEGAYYEREDGKLVGPARRQASLRWDVGGWTYEQNGAVSGYGIDVGVSLTRRVYFVPTDPAEVVAELWRRSVEARYGATHEDGGEYGSGVAKGLQEAKVFVAERLGVNK